jgi:hypothetical protein
VVVLHHVRHGLLQFCERLRVPQLFVLLLSLRDSERRVRGSKNASDDA